MQGEAIPQAPEVTGCPECGCTPDHAPGCTQDLADRVDDAREDADELTRVMGR